MTRIIYDPQQEVAAFVCEVTNTAFGPVAHGPAAAAMLESLMLLLDAEPTEYTDRQLIREWREFDTRVRAHLAAADARADAAAEPPESGVPVSTPAGEPPAGAIGYLHATDELAMRWIYSPAEVHALGPDRGRYVELERPREPIDAEPDVASAEPVPAPEPAPEKWPAGVEPVPAVAVPALGERLCWNCQGHGAEPGSDGSPCGICDSAGVIPDPDSQSPGIRWGDR